MEQLKEEIIKTLGMKLSDIEAGDFVVIMIALIIINRIFSNN